MPVFGSLSHIIIKVKECFGLLKMQMMRKSMLAKRIIRDKAWIQFQNNF